MNIKVIEEGLVYHEEVKNKICKSIRQIYKSKSLFLMDIIQILQIHYGENEDLSDFFQYFWIWLEKVNYEEIYCIPVFITFHMIKSLNFHQKETDKFKRRQIFQLVNQILIEYSIIREMEDIKNQYQDYVLKSNIYSKMCLSFFQEYIKCKHSDKHPLRIHNIQDYYEKYVKKYEIMILI